MESTEVPSLPARDERGHKGTFGTVGVIGGCAHAPADEGDGVHMIGGPAFAAGASLQAGCGLARLVMPEPVLDAALTITPSATGVALAVDEHGDIVGHLASEVIDRVLVQAECVVVGPGLGVTPGSTSATLRCTLQESRPVVIDADGLNCLAGVREFHLELRAPAVLTPHPGEFARLARALGIELDAPSKNPLGGATALAQRLGCVVVLKGASTAVSDGHHAWVHDDPNPVLGTAGTGDVLAGIIASLIAQHFRGAHEASGGGLGLFECAIAGVEAHARAARAWADETGCTGGMTAVELLERVAPAVESMRRA